MIVIIGMPDEEDRRYVEDADAVVVDPGGFVRICRSGTTEDEMLPLDTSICVVP